MVPFLADWGRLAITNNGPGMCERLESSPKGLRPPAILSPVPPRPVAVKVCQDLRASLEQRTATQQTTMAGTKESCFPFLEMYVYVGVRWAVVGGLG